MNKIFECESCGKIHNEIPKDNNCTKCGSFTIETKQKNKFVALWNKLSPHDYVQPPSDDYLDQILEKGRFFGPTQLSDEFSLGNCHADCIFIMENNYEEGDRLCTGYALTDIGYIQHTWIINFEDRVVQASGDFYSEENFGIVLEGEEYEAFKMKFGDMV